MHDLGPSPVSSCFPLPSLGGWPARQFPRPLPTLPPRDSSSFSAPNPFWSQTESASNNNYYIIAYLHINYGIVINILLSLLLLLLKEKTMSPLYTHTNASDTGCGGLFPTTRRSPVLGRHQRGVLQLNSVTTSPGVSATSRGKGSAPHDCPHIRHWSKAGGPQDTHTSVPLGYKLGGFETLGSTVCYSSS